MELLFPPEASGCLVGPAVFKTVEGVTSPLAGSIPVRLREFRPPFSGGRNYGGPGICSVCAATGAPNAPQGDHLSGRCVDGRGFDSRPPPLSEPPRWGGSGSFGFASLPDFRPLGLWPRCQIPDLAAVA